MIQFDYIGMVVVTILHFLLGVIWYSPALFKKHWMKAAKIKKMDMSWRHFLTVLLVGLISGVGMVLVIEYFTITSFPLGLLAGCVLAIAFTLPVIITQELWENRSLPLVYINGAYWLVFLALSGGLVAVI